MILDAEVELRTDKTTRHLPLEQFILGNRRTALMPGEMVTAVRVPKHSAAGASSFVKLGARRYLVISIAMVAARISIGPDGLIETAAICVGSCSAVAQRLVSLEKSLVGLRPGPALAEAIASADLTALAPIDDVRGTADYRREAAREIVLRAVTTAASRPVAEMAA
jgi:CO/xanthine dehydrogenase FAD-binding subunit